MKTNDITNADKCQQCYHYFWNAYKRELDDVSSNSICKTCIDHNNFEDKSTKKSGHINKDVDNSGNPYEICINCANNALNSKNLPMTLLPRCSGCYKGSKFVDQREIDKMAKFFTEMITSQISENMDDKKRNYRERYEKIAQSDEFKRDYVGKSLGDESNTESNESAVNYLQVVEMTDEEKIQMYMKMPKHELAKMLLQCNKVIDMLTKAYSKPIALDDNGGTVLCSK